MVFFQDEMFEELPELTLYFQQAKFVSNYVGKEKIYELFKYLVKRNYKLEAGELWDDVITDKNKIRAS